MSQARRWCICFPKPEITKSNGNEQKNRSDGCSCTVYYYTLLSLSNCKRKCPYQNTEATTMLLSIVVKLSDFQVMSNAWTGSNSACTNFFFSLPVILGKVVHVHIKFAKIEVGQNHSVIVVSKTSMQYITTKQLSYRMYLVYANKRKI